MHCEKCNVTSAINKSANIPSQILQSSTQEWNIVYRIEHCPQEYLQENDNLANKEILNALSERQENKEKSLCSLLIMGLEPRTEYNVMVRAYSSAGFGNWSAPVLGFTKTLSGKILLFLCFYF